ncbi:MAG: DUF2911 domain-containing protein [Flavobacteriales bacterium]|jgi:hypothetical protein|nr:DUF2911 domain-containing protein [Flavobacteriales bacterium]MBK6892504.1 DUF2911 domain-containing protein [Flavobacteriales bacterium]MBK7246642.1 DUF2911 domain-containing protein [Flavobacteriales bacterium]MBK9061051.1 DUF2911 domain-containing protein [Flavobacteriales bacterium]MBK9597677.1 DUF2911 domain-containing protein [Flavobacteriales bacterium]
MNRFLLPVAAVAISFSAVAQDLPKASPQGEVEQVVGLTKVEVEYSRPSVRGREIFGGLLPFDQLWRLGANANTTFEVNSPVIIEGEKLDKGKYSMFAIPGKESWVILFNKNTELWGEGDHKDEEDVLKVKAKVEPGEFTETLTISFDEVKDDKARMDIRWEKSRVSFWITADATEQAIANIKEAMAKSDIKAGTYSSCARFAVDRGIMTKESLEWAQKSVAMDAKYYSLHTLALAQAANGMKKEAIATAEKSIEASKKAGSDAYVQLNEAKIKEWSSK